MEARYSSGSTTARHLRTTAVVGGALIGYLVTKTPGARQRLEQLALEARHTGGLSVADVAVVEQALARHLAPKPTAVLYRLN